MTVLLAVLLLSLWVALVWGWIPRPHDEIARSVKERERFNEACRRAVDGRGRR